MSLDTAEAVQAVFRDATRQELQTRIRHDHERERYEAIGRDIKDRLIKEEQDWASGLIQTFVSHSHQIYSQMFES